ncbi:MAG: hypothetical protein ACE5RI_08125, partial [Candidatus Nitrosomaritimum yanchengensis]
FCSCFLKPSNTITTPIPMVTTETFSLVISLFNKNCTKKSGLQAISCLTAAIAPITINKIPKAVVGFLPLR